MKIYSPKKFKNLPKVVFFDLDNTLYPYEPSHRAGMDAVKEKCIQTLSIKEEDFDTFFNDARNQIKSEIKNTAASHSRLLYMQRMLELMGLGSQVLYALDFEQTYWRTLLNEAFLYDQVKDFLDDLRLLNIPCLLVTDLTAQIQFRKIIYFGIDQYFDYVITSEESGFDKPNKASFQKAMQKIKLDHQDMFWMIGDHPVNDISGAKEFLNAVTIQKTEKDDDLLSQKDRPDASFSDFSDIRDFVNQISKKD